MNSSDLMTQSQTDCVSWAFVSNDELKLFCKANPLETLYEKYTRQKNEGAEFCEKSLFP